MEFTHLKSDGNIKMVDVTQKDITMRNAIASGKIFIDSQVIKAIYNNELKKGNVLITAQLAGIMAIKKTADLIPLTHNINITSSDIEFEKYDDYIKCLVSVTCSGNTGVEMEAIVGVNIALTTIYDMCKAVDKNMVISDIKLEYKSGGKSGEFINER